jgi:hypothetical protein
MREGARGTTRLILRGLACANWRMGFAASGPGPFSPPRPVGWGPIEIWLRRPFAGPAARTDARWHLHAGPACCTPGTDRGTGGYLQPRRETLSATLGGRSSAPASRLAPRRQGIPARRPGPACKGEQFPARRGSEAQGVRDGESFPPVLPSQIARKDRRWDMGRRQGGRRRRTHDKDEKNNVLLVTCKQQSAIKQGVLRIDKLTKSLVFGPAGLDSGRRAESDTFR